MIPLSLNSEEDLPINALENDKPEAKAANGLKEEKRKVATQQVLSKKPALKPSKPAVEDHKCINVSLLRQQVLLFSVLYIRGTCIILSVNTCVVLSISMINNCSSRIFFSCT
ncbi:unnamed protein product [Cuscuta europaea]|uniref:Uncharacterized protein n=1 Tax=Cuscuta europaea TaxID=41803 RepID=A0A9P1EBL9_CUSEU|nr:unnamed protein product [Cuscuta europaea]